MKKANWIHVEYGKDRSALFSRAQKIVLDALDMNIETLVVQNDENADIDIDNAIYGSNFLREFSGWNEGIRYFLRQGVDNPDWWIFSNDTFFSHRYFWGSIFRGFIGASHPSPDSKRPLVIGDVLSSNMMPDDSSHYPYVSTYFYIVSNSALEKISFDLCLDAPLEWIDDTSALRIESETCPESVANFLFAHLLNPASKYSWYGAKSLSIDNVNEMRFKAKAIILEHNLSRRFSERGVVFKPIFSRNDVSSLRIRRALESRIEKLFMHRRKRKQNCC